MVLKTKHFVFKKVTILSRTLHEWAMLDIYEFRSFLLKYLHVRSDAWQQLLYIQLQPLTLTLRQAAYYYLRTICLSYFSAICAVRQCHKLTIDQRLMRLMFTISCLRFQAHSSFMSLHGIISCFTVVDRRYLSVPLKQ